MTRIARIGFWVLPPLFFVWFYWYGLRAYFQQDDFAWLQLRQEIQNWRDLLPALFEPRAQGTIRPWSERLFFIVLFDRFNLDPRPFHAVVAFVQVANIALLQGLTLRLSQSRLAAFAAPFLWMCGVGLATPLSWLSSFNQVLCAFFLMATMLSLMLAVESRRRRWWAATWVLFLLGFGALEIHVVFPALALAYLLLYRRERWKVSLPFFAVSGLYAAAHFAYAAKPKEGAYARHWDVASVFSTLDSHLFHLFSGGTMARLWTPPWISSATAAWVLGVLTLAFLLWAIRKRSALALFGLAWFLVTLAPVLPLRDHVMDYYLAIPSIGWAWIGGMALAGIPAIAPLVRWVAVAAVSLHLLFTVPVNRISTKWRYERGQRIRVLVEGLERAHSLHPGKTILLTGLDDELLWSALFDEPENVFGAPAVYLAPGAEKIITPLPHMGDLDAFVYAPALTARAVRSKEAVVYSYEEKHLRNITRSFQSSMPPEWDSLRPSRLELGQAVSAPDLGPGWYGPEGAYRWMGERATVYLSRLSESQTSLFLNGFFPVDAMGGKTMAVVVRIGGAEAGRTVLRGPDGNFTVRAPIPAGIPLNSLVEVTIEAAPAIRFGADVRALTLAVRQVGLSSGR